MRAVVAVAACLMLAGVTGCAGEAGPPPRPPAPHSSTPRAPASHVRIAATAPAPSPSGVRPTTLRVLSVTFVSATHGWLLGLGPYPSGTRVEETTDGGRHWQPLAAALPGTPSGIRFADAAHGYAYGDPTQPLDVTDDGGRTWHTVAARESVAPGLVGASDLETAAGLVWLLGEEPGPDVLVGRVGGSSFRDLGETPGDSLELHGSEAYLLGSAGARPVLPTLTVATTAGLSRRPLPCFGFGPQQTGDVSALTPLDRPGQLVISCVPDEVSGHPDESVFYRSNDDGRTWNRFASTGCAVLFDSLAATSTAVFGSCSSGIMCQPLSGSPSTMVLTGPSPSDFRYVGFTNDADGVAVDVPPGGNAGELYVTRDGGRHWAEAE